MKSKKNLEKEFHNMRLLLRESILTSNPLIITSKSSQNKNNNNQIQFKTNPNKIKSYENSTRKTFSFSLMKYKPKRQINFKGVNIPLPNLGKASLDYSKTFSTEKTIDSNKIKTIIVNENNKFNSINKTSRSNFCGFIKNENIIEFKNKYILKYAEYSDSFNKIYHLNNIISDAHKIEFKELYPKISKSLELQSQLLLDDLDNELAKEQNNNMMINPYLTASSKNSISLLNNNKKNENKLNEKLKKIIFLISEYNNYVIKFIHLLSKEIKESKNNYMKLLKINYDYELKINSQKKDLDDIKNYFEKYNIDKKIYGEKLKENSIKNIKSKFLKKENEYLLHNHQLKDEIFSLMELLDKNKSYFNKYKQAQKEITDSKKNHEILRTQFNKEIQDKNLEYALEKDQKEELILKLEELNESIKDLKEEEENHKRNEFETNAQILKLKFVINEKNENIMMINEELEHYIREYDKEKYNYQNTLNSLRSLENRIYNEEKKKKAEG